MPFKSKKQEEYLKINEPEVYQDWKEKYGSFKEAEEFAAYVSTDITKRVRAELKRAIPNMKFSVSKKDGTLRVAIMQGDLDFRDLWEDVPYDKQYWRRWNDSKPHFDGYVDINTYHTDSYNPKYTSVFNEIVDIMKGDEWFDKSDARIDYFHTAYYLSLTIGKGDRDYIYTGVPRMADLFRRAESETFEARDCVDIVSNFVEPSLNYYRVRFRNPKIFVGGKYTTPHWGQRAAMTIGKKYYGVSGCKITMAQPMGGRWVIQSVLIPKSGGVEMNEELALKMANHIQDRIEREGKWSTVICQDSKAKRYVSKINDQHIVRDEGGKFAPHAAEEFGAEDAENIERERNWGGDPDGKLAKALAKAREESKKPRKPLKIERLGAESFSADNKGKGNKTKNEIIEYLLSNCADENRITMKDKKYHKVNDKNWTIADLFIRQQLNNGCDGFGMENVYEVYDYLLENKEQLIEYDLLSKDGFNNSGFPLWKNYNLEYLREKRKEGRLEDFGAESEDLEPIEYSQYRRRINYLEMIYNAFYDPDSSIYQIVNGQGSGAISYGEGFILPENAIFFDLRNGSSQLDGQRLSFRYGGNRGSRNKLKTNVKNALQRASGTKLSGGGRLHHGGLIGADYEYNGKMFFVKYNMRGRGNSRTTTLSVASQDSIPEWRRGDYPYRRFYEHENDYKYHGGAESFEADDDVILRQQAIDTIEARVADYTTHEDVSPYWGGGIVNPNKYLYFKLRYAWEKHPESREEIIQQYIRGIEDGSIDPSNPLPHGEQNQHLPSQWDAESFESEGMTISHFCDCNSKLAVINKKNKVILKCWDCSEYVILPKRHLSDSNKRELILIEEGFQENEDNSKFEEKYPDGITSESIQKFESFGAETVAFESFAGRWNVGQTKEIEGVQLTKLTSGRNAGFRMEYDGHVGEIVANYATASWWFIVIEGGGFGTGGRYDGIYAKDQRECLIRWKHKVGGGTLVIRRPFKKARAVLTSRGFRPYSGVFRPPSEGMSRANTYIRKSDGRRQAGRPLRKNEVWLGIRYDDETLGAETFEAQEWCSNCGGMDCKKMPDGDWYCMNFLNNRETYDGRYDAETRKLKKDSCCCGATKKNPCECMYQGISPCSSTCPCALEK